MRTDAPQPYVQVLEQQKVVHQTVETGVRGELGGQAMVAVKGIPENALLIAGSVGSVRAGTVVRFTVPPTPGAK